MTASRIRVYLLDDAAFLKWKSKLEYVSYDDPKGYEGVRYISAAHVGSTFPSDVRAIDVNPAMSPQQILIELMQERITYPTLNQINEECSLRAGKPNSLGPSPSEVIALAASRVKTYPSVTLLSVKHGSLAQAKSLTEGGVGDGDVLRIKRNTVAQLIDDCQYELRERGICYRLLMLRDADDFAARTGQLDALQGKTGGDSDSWRPRGSRAKIALLYTDEDSHVASYVRTHFDALDRASGADCDVLFIESPSHIQAAGYWRARLDEMVFVIWRSLGWDRTKPYNKAEAYDIAKAIGVPISMMPCAVLVEEGQAVSNKIWPLAGNLTEVFRAVFSDASDATQANAKRDTSVESEQSHLDVDTSLAMSRQQPLCFLSHSSKDKDTVRQVATTLHTFGIDTWFDEWEIALGDSIPGKIQEGLARSSHVAIFLSKASIQSSWVTEELTAAIYRAVSAQTVKVIPVLLEECDVPALLASKARLSERDPHKIAYELQKTMLGRSRRPNLSVTD